MFKLDLEKAEEPEIKLWTSVGSSKKQESSRKTSTSASLTMPKPLTVWITINCGKFWKRWEYQTNWSASWQICMQVKKEREIAQTCLTLCDPVGFSLPGSSIPGIFQARVLEWVAISFSRESSQPRDQTQVSHIADRRFNIWATRQAHAGQEAAVRTGYGTKDSFQIAKGVHQGCILSPCLLNFYTEFIMRNTGLPEAQAGIKIAGRNINNLRYADDTTLMAECEEELKSLLMKVKGEWKSWLKAQHSENEDHGTWSHHFMGNRWVNSGNSVDFIFWGAPKSLQMVTPAMKLKDAYSLEGKLWPT